MKYQYSYSRIKQYLQCPLSFKLQYIDKLPIPKSKALLVGSCVHQILEQIVKSLITSGSIPEIFMLNLIDDNGLPFQPDVVEEATMLWDKYKVSNLQIIKLHEIASVEAEFAIDHNFKQVHWLDKNVFFRAKIDRIDENEDILNIIDYKTGYNEPDIFQAFVYAWLLSKIRDLSNTKIEITFDNIRTLKHTKYIVSDGNICDVENFIFKTVALIETDDKFEAVPNENCSFCHFYNDCPKMQRAISNVNTDINITSQELAEKAGELLYMAEIWVSKCKDKLKKWVDENGCVSISTGTYQFTTCQNTIIDTEKFIQRCHENHINPNPMLNIDKAKLKQKQFSHIHELVKDLISIEDGARIFKLLKA